MIVEHSLTYFWIISEIDFYWWKFEIGFHGIEHVRVRFNEASNDIRNMDSTLLAVPLKMVSMINKMGEWKKDYHNHTTRVYCEVDIEQTNWYSLMLK